MYTLYQTGLQSKITSAKYKSLEKLLHLFSPIKVKIIPTISCDWEKRCGIQCFQSQKMRWRCLLNFPYISLLFVRHEVKPSVLHKIVQFPHSSPQVWPGPQRGGIEQIHSVFYTKVGIDIKFFSWKQQSSHLME